MEIFPTLTPTLLPSADPGALVFYQGNVGFVVIDPQDPNSTKSLAIFDRAAKKFEPIYPTQSGFAADLLIIGAATILEPDFAGGIALSRASYLDGSRIFIHENQAFAGLQMGSIPQHYRLFDLTTGQIMRPTDNKPMAACSAWRLGIRDSEGLPRWLIQVQVPSDQGAS